MLAANEFTVGSVVDAVPLSLVLPRYEYESIALVGRRESTPMVTSLSAKDEFLSFEASGAHNWTGIIVPNVRIEVDETSVIDPRVDDRLLGIIIRLDTQLVIRAKPEYFYSGPTLVTLHDGLIPTGGRPEGDQAGFSRWQIVVGQGTDKRVLWQTP
jgi:hypothetical protein